MRYFKAQEIETPPYIQWDGWANSYAELVALGEEDNPLIMAESDIPSFEFGVCPLKIVDGALVARTVGEMEAAEAEYLVRQKLSENRSLINGIDNGTFTFDSQAFPMDPVSRLYYMALDNAPPTGDAKCMTAEGLLYSLPNANITAFVTAFYTQLRILSQPDV